MQTYTIVDFSALAHKYISQFSLHGPDGQQVTVTYNILRLIRKRKNLIFTFEGQGKSFRKQLDSSYKGNRVKQHSNFYQDCSLAKSLIEKLGIPALSKQGYEADDIIYSLCCKYPNVPFTILTVDKDILGCLAANSNLTIELKKEIWNKDRFEEEYEFSPNRFSEYKALVGDKSDNIPGVPRVGPKTAKKNLNKFDTKELREKYGENFNNAFQLVKPCFIYLDDVLPEVKEEVDLESIRSELTKLNINL